MNKNIHNAITIALILFVLWLGYLNHNKVKGEYDNRIQLLETEIESTREQRDSVVVLINRRDSVSKALYDLIDIKNKELSKVSGRYNKHTPTELEVEMNRRAGGEASSLH